MVRGVARSISRHLGGFGAAILTVHSSPSKVSYRPAASSLSLGAVYSLRRAAGSAAADSPRRTCPGGI